MGNIEVDIYDLREKRIVDGIHDNQSIFDFIYYKYMKKRKKKYKKS